MKFSILSPLCIFYVATCFSCTAQSEDKVVGGPCEGCEAVFEYGTTELTSIDTLLDYHTTDERLIIDGIVYHGDKVTPAKDVVIYVYHTNNAGLYVRASNASGWGQRHGKLRGWVKTDKDGRYRFYTSRPAPYPDGGESAHVHLTIKEPGYTSYYMDEIVFDDDPLLTEEEKTRLLNRGGSGICTPVVRDGIQYVTRDIILGMNIPGY